MSTPLSNPIHLFRAILREATYLPNAAARTFHARHVAASFRQHRLIPEKKDGGSDALPSKEETYYMKRARKYLHMLQRANQGYIKNLENVLKMTYARKGKRRRKIMDEIMARGSAEAGTPAQSSGRWRPSHEIRILLIKQNKIQDYLDKRVIKEMPKIPTLTKSRKPFPKRRAVKIMQRWYARQAQTLQVPLVEDEWLSLHSQATNLENNEGSIRERRPLASVSVFADAASADINMQNELEFIGCTSTQKGPAQQSRRLRKLLGNPHKITRRFLRRIVQRSVLQSSPTVMSDTETGRIGPRWDMGSRPQYEPQVITHSQALSMFY